MSKLNEYKILKELGQGCFGKVYLIRKILDNKLYVAKKIDLKNLDPNDGDKYIKNEKKIMELLNHKNIVHLYDYFEEKDSAFFIIEYCNGGSLAHHLESHKSKYKRPFNQKMVQLFGKQIVEGLNHIHSKGVIHRDIKLENILLNFNNKNYYDYKEAEIKIIDFGLSSLGPGFSLVGSPIYMDPRILEKYNKAGGLDELNKYDEKADIWSLGALFYEMITGDNLFKAQSLPELQNKAENGIYYLPLEYDLSYEIISFLNAMLQYEPENRATTEELLKHPFLNKRVHEFTPVNISQIAYKIENGIFKINFINNDTIRGIFNPDMANKIKNSKEINNDKDGNYIININETKLTNKVMKQNECLKKNINELLKDYNKVRIYFRENNLVSQETDAKQKIALLEKMNNDMNIGQPVDIKNLPNKISPEYIYGCSVEQRNDIFNQIINGLKKKREQYKTQNIKNLKDLNYTISNLEKSYKDEWTPPPKYKSQILKIPQTNDNNHKIKFIIKRKDELKENFSFTTTLVVNPITILKKNVELKPGLNTIIEWIWDFNETDWKNVNNNNENFNLYFDFKQHLSQKLNQLKINITQAKLGKQLAYNISQPISKEQKLIANISLIPIINNGNNQFIEKKELIFEKLYPSFELYNTISKSSIF